MRLSLEQTNIIRQAILETFGTDAQVTLFSSRVDDNRHGGDIDLLIKAPMQNATQALRKKSAYSTNWNNNWANAKLIFSSKPQTIPAPSFASRMPQA